MVIVKKNVIRDQFLLADFKGIAIEGKKFRCHEWKKYSCHEWTNEYICYGWM